MSAAQKINDLVCAARRSAAIQVHPNELIPSFLGRETDQVRLQELITKFREGGWRIDEPVVGVRLESENSDGSAKYRVYAGSHRTIAAQTLKLDVGFIRLLDLATCGLDWKFVEKNEALLVREIQVSEPAPEPFGVMAQVRLLQGLFTEYSETTLKGLAAVPTLSIARSIFCPGRSAELTSSDHFIFDQTHNVHKYYRGACKVIEAGVLNDLVRLECRYGSRQSFNITTLRSCERLNPEEIKTIVQIPCGARSVR
jgi:hypothetical protein